MHIVNCVVIPLPLSLPDLYVIGRFVYGIVYDFIFKVLFIYTNIIMNIMNGKNIVNYMLVIIKVI